MLETQNFHEPLTKKTGARKMKPKLRRLKLVSPPQPGKLEAPTFEQLSRCLMHLMITTNAKKTWPKQSRLEIPSHLLLLMRAVSTFAKLQIISQHKISCFQTTLIRNRSKPTLSVTTTSSRLTLPVTGTLGVVMALALQLGKLADMQDAGESVFIVKFELIKPLLIKTRPQPVSINKFLSQFKSYR